MLHSSKILLALAVAAGFATLPSPSWAESSSKTESASSANKNQAASDDFEENRRAHMQKSKENNAKKGAE